MNELKSLIRTIPDYPKPGIMFRDVTTLFGDAARLAALAGVSHLERADHAPDHADAGRSHPRAGRNDVQFLFQVEVDAGGRSVAIRPGHG